MAKLYCGICGKKVGLSKVMLKGGDYVCFDCVKAAGHNPLTWMGALGTSLEELKSSMGTSKEVKEKATVMRHPITGKPIKQITEPVFQETKSVGNFLKIDETNRLWYSGDMFGLKKSEIHSFDDIVSYDLLEDGAAVTTGGLGSAAVGGMLFGGVGAIVGGVTGKRKTKGTCSSLQVKITLNNIQCPAVYIPLLQMNVKKESAAYRQAFQRAQEILSILEVICKQNGVVQESDISTADEIRKYKALLDEGALSEKEFEEIKKKLLEKV